MKEPVADSQAPANVTLAVIAGGEGKRMGKPKAWLRIGQESILAWMLNHLQWPGPTLLVTAPNVPPPPDWDWFGNHVVDPIGGLGPMRGVLTALECSKTPVVLTVAVDMPLVDQNQLTWLTSMLLGRPDWVGVMCGLQVDGRENIEPFPAAYRVEAATMLSSQLEISQRSLRGLCRDPRFVALPAPSDWPEDVWTNLNDPVQFAAFEAGAAKYSRETSA